MSKLLNLIQIQKLYGYKFKNIFSLGLLNIQTVIAESCLEELI